MALDSLAHAMYFVDKNRKILLWNKKAEEITGFRRDEIIGSYCQSNILCHIDKDATPLCLTQCPIHDTLDDGKVREMEVFLRHKKGHRLAVKVSSSPVYENGTLLGVVEIFEQTQIELFSNNLVDSLTKLVMTDKLTGLPNRRYGENMIQARINDTKFAKSNVALMYFDLDNFSNCNNTYGHDVGDQVLRKVAEGVKSHIRSDDLICRWGGEEFLGLFVLKEPEEIGIIGEKIRKTIAEGKVSVDDGEVSITASVGITLLTAHDIVDEAVNRGDALMYESKKNGKNRVTIG